MCCTLPSPQQGRTGGVFNLQTTECREHPYERLALRQKARGLLHHVQPFGLHVQIVALSRRTTLEHRCELLLVGAQQFLQVLVQLDLLVNQQQPEIHVVHALANLIQIHLVLRALHIALPSCNLLLAADDATIEDRLLHIDSYPILVFFQPFHIDAHRLVHLLHLLGKSRHIALQRSLSLSRHLRQPPLLDVRHRQLGRLLNQPVLPYQRVVAFSRLLAFLERLRSCRAKRLANDDG